jgi:hypothetical protein
MPREESRQRKSTRTWGQNFSPVKDKKAAVLDCSNPQKGSKRWKTGKPGIGTSGTYPEKIICMPSPKEVFYPGGGLH